MFAEGCFADADRKFIKVIVLLCQNIAFSLNHWKALETTPTTKSNDLPAKLTLPTYPTFSLLINLMVIFFYI